MKPGIKKVASGKTMRVATLFTGAAACAAAFAPGAAAGTVHPAGTAHHARLDGKTLALPWVHRTMEGLQPDTVPTSNCGTTPRWVHLAYSRHKVSCFGFDGRLRRISPAHFSRECGGDNSGRIYGPSRSWHFGPGNTYTYPPVKIVSSISIRNSHAASNMLCPTIPPA
jgi:hypothetical protein